MKPAVQPQSVVPIAKAWLINRVSVEVRRNLADTWTPNSAPCIVLASDPDPKNQWPIATAEKLRITAWAAGEDAARALCGQTIGLFLAHRVDGIATIRGAGAVATGRDPSNNGFFATAILTATIRTTTL